MDNTLINANQKKRTKYSSNEVRSNKNYMKKWRWYVYIIECLDSLYYTGLTWNIEERIEQHKSGKGSKFTAKHGFKKLCYMEEYADITQAREREHQLKDFSRKKKEALWKENG